MTDSPINGLIGAAFGIATLNILNKQLRSIKHYHKPRYTLNPNKSSIMVSYDPADKDFIREIHRLEKDIKIKRRWWQK